MHKFYLRLEPNLLLHKHLNLLQTFQNISDISKLIRNILLFILQYILKPLLMIRFLQDLIHIFHCFKLLNPPNNHLQKLLLNSIALSIRHFLLFILQNPIQLLNRVKMRPGIRVLRALTKQVSCRLAALLIIYTTKNCKNILSALFIHNFIISSMQRRNAAFSVFISLAAAPVPVFIIIASMSFTRPIKIL